MRQCVLERGYINWRLKLAQQQFVSDQHVRKQMSPHKMRMTNLDITCNIDERIIVMLLWPTTTLVFMCDRNHLWAVSFGLVLVCRLYGRAWSKQTIKPSADTLIHGRHITPTLREGGQSRAWSYPSLTATERAGHCLLSTAGERPLSSELIHGCRWVIWMSSIWHTLHGRCWVSFIW